MLFSLTLLIIASALLAICAKAEKKPSKSEKDSPKSEKNSPKGSVSELSRQTRYDVLLNNINNYDGTGKGQTKL